MNPNRMPRPRPLLMVPLRRCGSHALRLRLNFNPDFYSPYPLHIVDFMPLVPLYGDLSDDRSYFQMVVDVVGLQAEYDLHHNRAAVDLSKVKRLAAAASR